ncbi:MAG: electron transfer flavoprotein subunit alpha/FixB family protein [Acidimicrobiia bacterium]|nr:electron transfer flavoprotein subunit alpha/FixB family protein [Acidimicrobiia bacterium]
MGNDVLILAEHQAGSISDITFELLGKAKEVAGASGGRAIVALFGNAGLAGELGAADVVFTMDDGALASYTAEAYEKALAHVVEQHQPRLVLLGTTTAGLDVAASLSEIWGAPLVSYVVGLESEGDTLVATAQIYGGKLMAEVALEGDRAIAAVTAGSFPGEAGRGTGSPAVEAVEPPAELGAGLRTTFIEMILPEAGDVDITAADMLVAVGRGIGSEGDVELVQELADAMGAPLAASRPITDLGWLPKSRQVGKSGVKVKPRAYLMFGVSGAPEHLEGMRDAELIIACNTDAQAPIFDTAHYGTTVDLFDLLPALTEKLGG